MAAMDANDAVNDRYRCKNNACQPLAWRDHPTDPRPSPQHRRSRCDALCVSRYSYRRSSQKAA